MSTKAEIETIVHTESNIRISVSQFDEDVWLSLQGRDANMHTVLTSKEARRIMEGLKSVLDASETL